MRSRRTLEAIAPERLVSPEGERRPSPALEDTLTASAFVAIPSYLAAAVLIGTGYRLWQEVEANLHVVALYSSLACYVVGFAVAWFGSLTGVSAKRRENFAIGGLLFAFLAYAINYAMFRSTAYGTDAMLFNAYSAELVSHGLNPYVANMQPAFGLFDVPKNLVTPTTTGGAIFSQSYPALSFLVYVPFAFLGINALWLSIAAHLALLWLLISIAPRPLKAIAPLVMFADPSYAEYTLGSVTDILWAVPVALSAKYWRSKPVIAAMWLGVACGIKQTPWFIVPFALVAWAFSAWERRRWTRLIEPLSALLFVFVLPNAPFIVADPAHWLSGILTPMQGNLIAFGSGIVQLTTANVYVTDLNTLTTISAGVLGLLVIAYALDRRRLGFLPFLAPGIALFFAARSLQNYFMFWPVALVAYFFSPAEDVVALSQVKNRVRLPSATAAAAALACVLLGFFVVRGATAASSPVRVSIMHYGYDGETNNISSFTVRLTNDDRSRFRDLRFGVLLQGSGSHFFFWQRQPQHVSAGQSLETRVSAPTSDTEVQPLHNSVQVVAIDAVSGEQFYSDAVPVEPQAAGLANPHLASWQAGPPSTPTGWEYSQADFKARYIKRVSGGGQNMLSWDVGPPINATESDEWHVASIGQQLTGTLHKFSVRLRPYANYLGNAYPRAIFGIELIDPLGHHAYYTIDSSLLHPEVFKHDQFTVFDYPGRIKDWNTIEVDPDQLKSVANFVISESTQVQISVIGAVHRGEKVRVRGDFGGLGGD